MGLPLIRLAAGLWRIIQVALNVGLREGKILAIERSWIKKREKPLTIMNNMSHLPTYTLTWDRGQEHRKLFGWTLSTSKIQGVGRSNSLRGWSLI